MQWYFIEMDSENMYTKNFDNEETVNMEFEGFIMYLQLMNLFMEKRG